MIHFAPFLTRRLHADFSELSIAQAVRLANIPDTRNEAAMTELLRAATRSAAGATLPDPALWSVEERMLGVGYYLAHVEDDGPDFSVGEGRYSDYLLETDYPVNDAVGLGMAVGDEWTMRPLLGGEAQVIESLSDGTRLHWIVGAMAAQMSRVADGDKPDAFAAPVEYGQWLTERMAVFGALPESDFVLLLAKYEVGAASLRHFFTVGFSEAGPVALAKGGAGSSLPAARFPAHACLSETAQHLGGKPADEGG